MDVENSFTAADTSGQPASNPAGKSTGRDYAASSSTLLFDFSSSSARCAPLVDSKMDTNDMLVASRPSSKHVHNSLYPNPASKPPTLRAVIESLNSQTVARSSILSASIPLSQVLGDTTCRDTALAQPHSATVTVTSLEVINDPILRNQVGSLQQIHPWASVTLCHSMLAGCRYFVDASTALRKIAGIEIPEDKDEKPGSPAQPASRGKVCAPSSFNSSFVGSASFEGLDGFDGFLPTSTFSFSDQPSKPLSTSTSSSQKRSKKTQVGAKIESDEQLISFSRPTQSSPDTFSRAERQRVITSSTETAADRERISFIANAVLYRAFSVENPSYGPMLKSYSPYGGVKNFPMTFGPFSRPSEKCIPPTLTHRGTDKGKFQPLTFNTPDGRVALQSISLTSPYLRTSFEELRFGDYIRGRKKAPHLFDLFRKLPAEIRCMIWRFAMPPRTVELRHNYTMNKCWTLAKVPALLQVCRESRYEALKRYTLAFGIEQTPDKIYFDFERDALFLTYEKWHGDGEYEDEVNLLTYHFCQSGEAKKIRHLAIDRDLVEIFARRLEDEEEEWYDEGDESMPEPEIEVIPAYSSLESLAIVKTAIDGFWYHYPEECGECDDKDCAIKKRMKKNDNAVMLPAYSYHVANKTQQEYYKQLIAQIKLQNSDWGVPELSYMMKRARRNHDGAAKARPICTCGGCYSDVD